MSEVVVVVAVVVVVSVKVVVDVCVVVVGTLPLDISASEFKITSRISIHIIECGRLTAQWLSGRWWSSRLAQ